MVQARPNNGMQPMALRAAADAEDVTHLSARSKEVRR